MWVGNMQSIEGLSRTKRLSERGFLSLPVFALGHRFSPALKLRRRDFPGGPVVQNLPSNAGTQVRSLIGELRSHMPRGN